MAPTTDILITAIIESAAWVIMGVAIVALLAIALLYLFEMIKDRAFPVIIIDDKPTEPPEQGE